MVDRLKIEGAGEGRPLQYSLQQIRRGDLMSEAGQELANLLFACQQTGRKGKLTLTIEVKPTERGSAQMQIDDHVKVALPEADKSTTFMYVGDDGQLQRNDPNQEDVENLRTVADNTRIREVGDNQGGN